MSGETKLERGAVFLVGGHETAELFGEFTVLCPGDRPQVCVITNAATNPNRKIEQYREYLESCDADTSFVFHIDRDEADKNSEILDTFERADGVYFSGGHQAKLLKELRGTALLDLILSRHREGMAIGGTSAGASAMSSVMITRSRRRGAGAVPPPHMRPGFGVLPDFIIDQHFSERGRLGRLVAAVSKHPRKIGIGLDENTAATIRADGSVRISGSGRATFAHADVADAAARGWKSADRNGVWAMSIGPGSSATVTVGDYRCVPAR